MENTTSTTFLPWQQIIKYSTVIPSNIPADPSNTYAPSEVFVVPFQQGTADPTDPAYSNHAMFNFAGRSGPARRPERAPRPRNALLRVVPPPTATAPAAVRPSLAPVSSQLELRVPWMMIGFADPSVHGVYNFVGCFPDITYNVRNVTDDLFLEPILLSQVDPLYQSSAFLNGGQATLGNSSTVLYQSSNALRVWWEPWTDGCYCERYKQDTGYVASYFGAIKRVPPGTNYTWNGTAVPLPATTTFCECSVSCK